MSNVIQQLNKDHVNVSRLLDLLERQIETFRKRETPNYTLMLDAMHYMVHYPDLIHHPKEDLVFEKLKNRNPDASAAIGDLIKEHKALSEKSTQFLESLRCAESETTTALRETVTAQGEDYISLCRNHMNKEELGLFPAALQVLNEQDWANINAAMKFKEDPVFGKVVKEEYRALYDWLGEQNQ